jgi:predicted RNA-binding protein with PUA-like domain
MAYWLLKTEPGEYSFERLVREGRTVWDGVTNALALKHMRAVRKNDRAIVYHTGEVRAAVGLARVTSDPYPDPRARDPKIVVFDVAPAKALARPVTLAQVKACPRLAGFDLVRIGRLSVMPVSDAQWRELMAMAGEG